MNARKTPIMMFSKAIPLCLAVLILISCAACGDRTKNLNMAAIGETFTSQMNAGVKTSDTYHEGHLSYTINSVLWSDNVKELGVDPSQLDEYASISFYWTDGELVAYTYPDYVDLETGQLAYQLRFVLVDLTGTNVDAVSQSIPESGGDLDASWYAFPVNRISVCDLNVELQDSFFPFDAVWYAGTGDYDPAEGNTNGSNYFILWPGESLTYQLGFVIGSAEGDFSRMCLTDQDGVYSLDEAVYVPLGMA